MELKETVDLMLSEDYKDRFKAEYYQAKIRYEKLKAIIAKAEASDLPFPLSCPLSVLEAQEGTMQEYLNILENRAEIEKVEL